MSENESGYRYFPKHSQSQPKGHASRVVMNLVDKVYDASFPAFNDVFPDEETFYVAAAVFTLVTVVAAFVASRYINIKNRG